MPQQPAAQIAVAALSFELAANGDTIPTEAHLLPPGPFRALDGRPYECPGWLLDAVIAGALVALAASRQNDILIDFEHQSLRSIENGKRVEAAGWIPRTLEWREGKGLYAVGINWVGDTPLLIKEKKVRYISALFAYDGSTGAVLEILSVGLTNTPALDGLEALAALARTQFIDSKEEAKMPGSNEQAQTVALTQERDGLKTSVAALTQERDSLKTKVAALTQERDALVAKEAATAAEKEKADHAALLQAALNDGRLAPAQKVWAEKLSLAALTECLATLTPIAMLNKQTTGLAPAGEHGLSDVELAACARMGVSPEVFKKTKAD